MNEQIAIKAEHLSKKYGSFQAVDDLNLEIYKGEVFGFLGPNGAGKTTSINMICGLLQPSSGTVNIFGKMIKDQQSIKTKIGVCPQENIFWPKLTCLEQLTFIGEMYGMGYKMAKNRSKEYLDFLGLMDKAQTLASKLSGGMKRRLGIGLALIHEPEIVILDEPEAGLDPQSRILVREFIKELSKEKTIIITTHNMDEADRLAERIAIIDHGKLLKLDTPLNLKKSIGQGDILEIELANHSQKDVETAIDILNPICQNINVTGFTLILKSSKLIEKIADIMNLLKSNQIKTGEMKLRENTLEDVFINLTGRKLRE